MTRPARRAGAQSPLVLKVATTEASGSPVHDMMRAFGEHAVQVSGGQIDVKLFTGGALGEESATLERLRGGGIQAGVVSLEALAAQVPAVAVLLSPYLFRSAAQADRHLDGAIAKALRAELPSHDLIFAAWGPSELRGWASRGTALRTPADAKGLAHPAARSQAERLAAEALGLQLTDTPLGSLTGGFVDAHVALAAMTPLETLASGLDRGATHYTRSDHQLSVTALIYSKLWFDGLPEDPQRGLAKLPAALTHDARKALRTLGPQMLEALSARGVEVVEPSPRDRKTMSRALRGIPNAIAREHGAAATRLLRAAR